MRDVLPDISTFASPSVVARDESDLFYAPADPAASWPRVCLAN